MFEETGSGFGVEVGIAVAVGVGVCGTGVAVGAAAVAVGVTAVAVGGTAVAVRGTAVAVGGTGVGVADGSAVGVDSGVGEGPADIGVAVDGWGVAVAAIAWPSGTTVTILFIEVGCSRQKYWNVPSSVNVKEKELACGNVPLSQTPVLSPREPEVVVCAAGSWLVQVTLVPTVTTRSSS
ncbi:MAG: hypothetical protein QF467_05250 [SAR202 cluster bacterium]|jgi:hypothetical protein|nr:hypothetical protein [SAR202 cluster bacterium]